MKISVILPVYNAEKYLRQCVDSLISQSLHDIEIIAINDGSTDSSLAILQEYALRDPRLIIINQVNGGAGKARNTGLDAAKGEYLSFLDADDFFEPKMLEESYKAAVIYNADISVYLCDFFIENEDCFKYESWKLQVNNMPQNEPFNCDNLNGNVFRMFMGWAWDKLFKSEFIKKHNLRFQEQRTANDLLFVYSAIVLAESIIVVPKILVHQRCNVKDSLSKTRENSWEDFYKALLELRKTLLVNGIYEKLEKDFINYALNLSMWNYRTISKSTQKLLDDALCEKWFYELGIFGKSMPYLLDSNDKEDYMLYKAILDKRSYIYKRMIAFIHNYNEYGLINTAKMTIRKMIYSS